LTRHVFASHQHICRYKAEKQLIRKIDIDLTITETTPVGSIMNRNILGN